MGDGNIETPNNISLLPVSAQSADCKFKEICLKLGHSLGLDHSKATGAVMVPIYRGWDSFLQLAQDDIDNVVMRYK